MINVCDINLYVKSQLNFIKRNITDSVLQTLSTYLYQQLDKQSQIFFLLRLILNENYLNYLIQHEKKLNSIELNIEDIINTYLRKKYMN